jgi:nickel superoxide dismutase
MLRALTTSIIALSLASVVGGAAHAHCQVPCGIYDDAARLKAMHEDVTTIEKAVRAVSELAGKTDATSVNQATRWILTKEEHASRIITTVSEYFLTQKLQPAESKDAKAWAVYLQALTEHHAVMRAAMKTKQTVSLDAVRELHDAVAALERRWLK